jgi:hypothetical protein
MKALLWSSMPPSGSVSPLSANICASSSIGRASTSPKGSSTELRPPALARPCRTIVYFF